MISICIPIYNFQVCDLVSDIQAQAVQLNLTHEIICIDDASEKEWVNKNECLYKNKNVLYYELKENIGRSKIRNLLAEKSNFDLLLFIDCDSALCTNNYLSNYLDNHLSAKVIYGGRVHAEIPPKNNRLYLRWLYGVNREDEPHTKRNNTPYLSFKSNNFLIHKKTLLNIKFDEAFKGYGHEDTFFAQKLKENKVIISHINNPLIHIGLENGEEFLSKTKEGIKNLILLMNGNSLLLNEIKLIKTYRKLKKYKLTSLFKLIHPILNKLLTKKLLSSNPKLFYLDMYKLTFLIHYLK